MSWCQYLGAPTVDAPVQVEVSFLSYQFYILIAFSFQVVGNFFPAAFFFGNIQFIQLVNQKRNSRFCIVIKLVAYCTFYCFFGVSCIDIVGVSNNQSRVFTFDKNFHIPRLSITTVFWHWLLDISLQVRTKRWICYFIYRCGFSLRRG